ncbi:MAG: RsmG family class I SAM-dependent methyltransferase [Sphingobium sp.]
MTEDEALGWLAEYGWQEGRAADRLRRVVDLVVSENERQNLISASTIPQIWGRHIVDSAQLLPLAGEGDGLWIDLGSGGGFPGLVIACLRDAPLRMVEVRPLRARFLADCVTALGLSHVMVEQAKAERVMLDRPARYLSARAFAALDKTLALASHMADRETCWLLPKGRNAQLELVTAQRQWQGLFHVEHSVTDPDSAIIVASGVARRYPMIAKPARRR